MSRQKERKKERKNNPGQRSFSFSAFKTSEAMHYSPRKTRNTPRHEGQSAESKLERQPGRQHFIRGGGGDLLECRKADVITEFRGEKNPKYYK